MNRILTSLCAVVVIVGMPAALVFGQTGPGPTVLAARKAQIDMALRVQRLQPSADNIVCSPYDLWETLALLEFASLGKTQQELQTLTGRTTDIRSFASTLRQIRLAGFPSQPDLGIRVRENGRYGVKIASVADWQKNLAEGDLIFNVDDEVIRCPQEFNSLVENSFDQLQLAGYELESGRPFNRAIPLAKMAVKTGPKSERPLLFATGLWTRAGVDVLDGYKQLVKQHFDAGVFATDFSSRATFQKQATEYFAVQLGDRKPDAYQVPELSSQTAFVVTTTVDFERDWELPFDVRRSVNGEFTSFEKKMPVSYMRQQDWFRYSRTGSYRTIDLPYLDSSLSMLLVLPQPVAEFQKIEQEFLSDRTLFMKAIQAESTEVQLEIPRFAIQQEIRLKAILQQFGVQQLFDRTADLGGMFTSVKDRPIWLDDIHQRVSIQVNEKGTTARSQTDAVGVALSASNGAKFLAHHPFLFFVHDDNGVIFFSGRVAAPSLR